MAEQYPHYFQGPVEFEAKNPFLVWARETVGLTAVEAAKQIGIAYQPLVNYENLRNYPSPQTQARICDFYRNLGVFLFEEDVFPSELKHHKSRIYMPKELEFVSLASIDGKVDGNAEDIIIKRIEAKQIRAGLEQVLSSLYGNEFILQKAFRLRYGIENGQWETKYVRERYGVKDGEKMPYKKMGRYFGFSHQMAQYLLKKAEHKIRLRALNNRVLRESLPASTLNNTNALVYLIRSLL